MAVSHASRRDLLLTRAASLFRHRGYHAVGVDDIGAAAGISGPAVYRHFQSKGHVLVALFDRVVAGLLEKARDIRANAAPGDALAGLVHAHAHFAVANAELVAVYQQEAGSLPEPARGRLLEHQRRYVDEWVAALRQVRPDVTAPAARAAVHGALGLLNSVANQRSRLAAPALEELLSNMALTALRG